MMVSAPQPATDAAALPALEIRIGVIARTLTLSMLIAISLALGLVLAFGGDWITRFVAINDITAHEQRLLISITFVAAAVGIAIGVATLWVAQRKGIAAESLERFLWFLCPLIVLPFIPQLFRARPWKDRADVLVALVLAIALVTEVLLFESFRRVPARVERAWQRLRDKAPPFWRKHGPLLVVVAATLFYVAFMSFYNLRWHYKLKTHNFDLSIDNNLIYSALKGGHMTSTVGFGAKADQYLAAHAKLGQYVILPIYALYPQPQTLIVIQSLLLGLGALPLFGFARRYVSSWLAVLIAIAYLCYYPLHSANFTESKYLSLSGFFVLASFWAAEYRRWILFVLAFVAAALMREDVPIGLAVGGAFLLFSGHRPVAGSIMAVVATGWFVYLRFFIMDRAGTWWFPGMYKGLWSPGQEGYVSVLKTLLTNPLFVLNVILEKAKLLYFLHLMTPLVLLPLRRWYLWAALIPGTVLTLFVTDYKPIQGFTFQYVMHWIPYLFLATPLALAAIERASQQGFFRARAAVGAVCLSSAALSFNYGGFARRSESVKGGYFYIDFTYTDAEARRYQDLKEVIKRIPQDASVVASENVGPHVSSRRYMYALRRGIYDAEYMLAARNELDFEQTRKLFTESVKSGSYGVVARKGDFALLRKGMNPAGNAQLAEDWKL